MKVCPESMRSVLPTRLLILVAVVLCGAAVRTPVQAFAQAPAGRVLLGAAGNSALSSVQDAGPLPGAQPMSLTLTLAPTPDRTAALTQFLSALVTPGSASFHKWLAPADFASAYGASADQVTAATSWAQAQGLTVTAVSPSGLRMTVTGTATQVQSALAVPLHQYQAAGQQYFANAAQPSLPAETSSLIVAIDGLDNLPADTGLSASAMTPAGTAVSSFATLAAVVDANQTPVLTLDSSLCSAAVNSSQIAEYAALFQQASAQGMTIFADRNCAGGSFPAALADVVAVAVPGSTADTTAPLAARPAWQAAPGLPSDALRYAPDVTAPSVSALAQTISTIVTQTGNRQGNISAVLYELAPEPGLYTQPDSAATDTWQPASGLGMVNLETLAKVYPRGVTPPTLNVTVTPNPSTYGTAAVVAVTVPTASGEPTPTGSIVFTSSQAGFPSGGGSYLAGGTLSQSFTLPGNTYNITATYSGDGTYSGSTYSFTLTVNPAVAYFDLSGPSTSPIGTAIDISAAIESTTGYGTPQGTITITPNGSAAAGLTAQTQNVSGGNGVAATDLYFTPTRAGTINFQAACSSTDNNFTCSTQSVVTVTVPQAASMTTLTINPTNPVGGTVVTFTAAVTGSTAIAPTGNIQFMDGSTVLGSGSAPSATYKGTLSPGSTHSLSAVYQGDNNYTTSTGTASATVATEPTTLTIMPGATVYTFGSMETVTVNVGATNVVNGTPPTGTVVLLGAGAAITGTVANGSSTVTFNLPVGAYNLSASYSGDSNYAPSLTGTATVLTVTPATGTLTANFSTTSFTTGSTATLTVTLQLPGNSVLPSGSTFTATVQGAGTVYTGTFNVNAGGNSGTGAVTLNAPAAGTYTVQIACTASANYVCTPITQTITSTASGTTTSTGTALTATLSAPSLSTSSFTTGSTATLTETVTLPGNNQLPANSTFVATIISATGATYAGTFSINAGGNTGTGAVTLLAPLAGTYTLQVTCGVNATFTCAPVSTTITSTATSVATGVAATIVPTLSTSAFTTGSTSTLSVTVTLAGANFFPSGSTFIATIPGTSVVTYVGALTTTSISNVATGSLVINAPPAGTYNLQITCGANTSFTCTPVSLPITSSATGTTTGTLATTTTLALSTTTPTAGQALVLTATVVPTSGSGTVAPTGTVLFYDGTTLLGTVPVTDIGIDGLATLSITLAGTTTHSLIAAYSGDSVYAPSDSTATAIATTATPAAITLSSSATTGLAGVDLTLTAQVSGSTAAGTGPTGTVSFYLGGTTPALLGTVALTPDGAGLAIATLTTSGLPAGTQTIYAVYSGDTNFSTLTSSSITIGLSDFSVVITPASLTISQGNSGQAAFTVTPIGGFSGAIAFGCLPQANTNITCSFNPTILNGAGNTILTVNTFTADAISGGTKTARSAAPLSGAAGKVAGGLSLATLLCVLLPGRRRRRLTTLILALLALGLSANLGCSQNNFFGNNAPSTGTSIGTSIVTVTVAGTNGVSTVRHTYFVQVTVQ